jgi:hypothetical protein
MNLIGDFVKNYGEIEIQKKGILGTIERLYIDTLYYK